MPLPIRLPLAGRALFVLPLIALAWAPQAQAQALFEDFEDADVTYTTSLDDPGSKTSDYFRRTDGSDINAAFNDGDGSFFAAQDIDGVTGASSSEQTLTFSGIDISGLTDLEFSARFAEDDASDGNEDWDRTGDFLLVEAQIDGGGFFNVFAIQNDGSTFNSAPFEDTDFDGVGDGAEITDTFQEFTKPIAGTGSSLDLRITMNLNAGDEDVAFDDVTVSGTAAPALGACDALIISDFETAPDAEEYVDLTNVGTAPIDFGTTDCVLGGFRAASYLTLPPTGTLLPGETLRFGASDADGVDIAFPAGQRLLDAYAALALLEREELEAGTSIPAVQEDLLHSLVYLTGGTVFGFYHVEEGPAAAFCALYAFGGRLHPYAQSQCGAVLATRTATGATAGKDGAEAAGSPAGEADLAALLEAAQAEGTALEAGDEALPQAFALSAAYPNPLRNAATLEVTVPEASEVRVVVYDVLGRAVEVLLDRAVEAGYHSVTLDGGALAPGTYLVRMAAEGGFEQTQRITVVR